jgi:hypothetical protein
MKVRSVVRGLVVATILAMLGALLPQLASAAPEKASGRCLVRARSSADYTALRPRPSRGRPGRERPAAAQHDGAERVVVRAGQPGRRPADPRGRSQPGAQPHRRGRCTQLDAPGVRGATQLKARAPAAAAAAGINSDPAWDYKGLLWDYRRIGLPQGWKTSAGSSR